MSVQKTSQHDSKPWFRQFWPWFLIAIPASAVAGSLATLAIAVRHADSLVKDDWYREGKAINRRLERDTLAKDLGLSAELVVSQKGEELRLVLRGPSTGRLSALRLDLAHPTLAERDQLLTLQRTTPTGVFLGRASAPIRGRWYATLSPAEIPGEASRAAGWRLTATAALPSAEPIRFGTAP